MKKIFGTFSALTMALLVSACGMEIPQCVDTLDNCARGGPYTEERTAQSGTRFMVKEPEPILEPVVMPEPAPVVEPEPEPVVVAPEPAPVVDTQVMTSAEPQFKQISK